MGHGPGVGVGFLFLSRERSFAISLRHDLQVFLLPPPV